jgi:hypothetical protein
MSLISCLECNHQVSDKAWACPQCGSPIADATTVTIQGTSKGNKLDRVLYGAILIVGLGWLMLTNLESTAAFWVTLVGVTGWIYSKFITWWHHS